jgi:DNA modification methylase
VNLADLSPAPYNPRRISDEAAAGLARSLDEFGDISGITFNRRTGRLVTGHQRVDQLRARHGDLEVKRGVIRTPDGETFRVRFVDWDEATEKAANLAANNPHIGGEWDDGIEALLREVGDISPDLFGDLNLDALLAEVVGDGPDEAKAGHTDPDEVPEPPAEPVTQRGDLWLLGEHRLLCGDSGDADDVQRLMRGEKAVLLATDPPYGVDYVAKARDMDARGYVHSHAALAADIDADEKKGDALVAFLVDTLGLAVSHCEETAAVYVWHADSRRSEFQAAMEGIGLHIHQSVMWLKPGFVIGRCSYHARYEPCLHGWRKGHRPPWRGNRSQSNVWEEGRENDKVHPTQKPVALFTRPIANHTRRGEIVLEPFAGSGTQVIAAEQLSRCCRAMEKSPTWTDVILRRWCDFTDADATRERDGASFRELTR